MYAGYGASQVFSCVVSGEVTDPVVEVHLLVAMVIGIVEATESVISNVHLSVLVQVVVHLIVGISVAELRVVMERNDRERVEVIGIDGLSLGHALLESLSGSLLTASRLSGLDEPDGTTDDRVEGKVRSVADSAKSRKHVSLLHFQQ